MLHHNGPDISTSDAYMARTGLHHERESNSSIRMPAIGLGNCKQTICLSWLSKVLSLLQSAKPGGSKLLDSSLVETCVAVWEIVSQVSRMEVSVMDNVEIV